MAYFVSTRRPGASRESKTRPAIVQVLAEQHMGKLQQLIEAMPAGQRPVAALLTGSTRAKPRREVYAGLASGDIHIVVGTHALITDKLEFKCLGLAVVDEQHRYACKLDFHCLGVAVVDDQRRYQ